MQAHVESRAFHVLEAVPSHACGALVRRRPDGTVTGALLIEHGRVCWAMSQGYPRRLTDLLVEENCGLSSDELNAMFALCRRDQLPLGETLVNRGMVPLAVFHRALLRHTCEALDSLLREEPLPWTWIPHSGYGYHPQLTFSPAELLAGLGALANPALAARALTRLRELVRADQRGFAVEPVGGARIPLAQVRCDGLEVTAIADLALQASEVMAVAATAGVEFALAELGELACASWIERDLLFVLLCDGELAFNRLLAQVAAMAMQP